MTGKERILNTINSKDTDRIANMNIIMQYGADEIKVKYAEYCTNYKSLVAGNIACAQKYGIDCVTVMSDALTEAADFGINAQFPLDEVPFTKEHLSIEQVKKIKPIKPEDGKRMTNRVKAIEHYKKESKDEYAIIGWVEGAFAEMSDLRGVNELMIDMYDEPEFVHDTLEMCLQQGIMLAQAQVDMGADIIGVGDAICSVAGPVAYKEFAFKYQERLLKAIKDMGVYTKLHICGNTQPLLPMLPAQYIDILDLDWMVDIDVAHDVLKDKVVLGGNYDPVAIMLQGEESTVREWVIKCASHTKKYVSAAGCEVPRYTPEKNLACVTKTLEGM